MKFEFRKFFHQKTALADGFNNSGSEFPDVTEQAFFISEALGRVPSDPSRGMISTLASTFVGDGLSTHILSPTDSSATPLSADYFITQILNKKAFITEGLFIRLLSDRVGFYDPPRLIHIL